MGKKGPRLDKNNAGPSVHHYHIKDKNRLEKRLKASFRRVNLTFVIGNGKEEIRANAVLAEIKPKSAYIFSEVKLPKYSKLKLKLKEPLRMEVNGVVLYSEKLEGGRISGMENGRIFYRTFIKYQFSSESEVKAMRDFYQRARDEDYVPTQWHVYVTQNLAGAENITALHKVSPDGDEKEDKDNKIIQDEVPDSEEDDDKDVA